jgi:predicted nucleic acid-binding protein
LRFVLDCSVAVKWYVPEVLSDVADDLLAEIRAGKVRVVAPDSIFAEMGHALRRHLLAGRLLGDECDLLMARFVATPIPTVPTRRLAEDAMRLTVAEKRPFYDALYVALAIREDLRVLTVDGGMIQSFAKLNRTVHLTDFRS